MHQERLILYTMRGVVNVIKIAKLAFLTEVQIIHLYDFLKHFTRVKLLTDTYAPYYLTLKNLLQNLYTEEKTSQLSLFMW